MVRTVSPTGSEPTLQIFDTLTELRSTTGHQGYHGFFDPRQNTIIATADSLPHEIGHYRDFKSGRMANTSTLLDKKLRAEGRIRNEIVAILFAYSKVGEGGTALEYEYRLIQWIEFMRKDQCFGPHTSKDLKEFTLSEIQDFAEWVVMHEHPWYARLEYLFRAYIADELTALNYSY